MKSWSDLKLKSNAVYWLLQSPLPPPKKIIWTWLCFDPLYLICFHKNPWFQSRKPGSHECCTWSAACASFVPCFRDWKRCFRHYLETKSFKPFLWCWLTLWGCFRGLDCWSTGIVLHDYAWINNSTSNFRHVKFWYTCFINNCHCFFQSHVLLVVRSDTFVWRAEKSRKS